MSKTNSDEIREVKRQYYRRWREKNPDKVKANNDRFWQRKLENQRRLSHGIPASVEIRNAEER